MSSSYEYICVDRNYFIKIDLLNIMNYKQAE